MENINILICTPAYGHQVTLHYFYSILRLIPALKEKNIESEVYAFGNESLISRARNLCMAKFLSKEKYTHLLFIDADIGFNVQNVFRLLEKDVALCGGSYPKKVLKIDALKKFANLSEYEMLVNSVDYVGTFLKDPDNEKKAIVKVEKDGFAEVQRLGAGMLLVRKDVILEMIEKYPELHYTNGIPGVKDPEVDPHYYAFFQPYIHNNTYLSEDFAFCERWRALGGKLYMDMTSPLTHHGSIAFKGHVGLALKHWS